MRKIIPFQGTTPAKSAKERTKKKKAYSQLGGPSNAMGFRTAATFFVAPSEDWVVDANRKSMFAHGNEEALLGGEFFTRVAWKLIHGRLKFRMKIRTFRIRHSTYLQRMAVIMNIKDCMVAFNIRIIAVSLRLVEM
jgi:hypothetical protein